MELLFHLLGECRKLIAVLLISAAVVDSPCHFANSTQWCQRVQLVAVANRDEDHDARQRRRRAHDQDHQRPGTRGVVSGARR
jgi:hypothetical protein